jgi:hypothetical protein
VSEGSEWTSEGTSEAQVPPHAGGSGESERMDAPRSGASPRTGFLPGLLVGVGITLVVAIAMSLAVVAPSAERLWLESRKASAVDVLARGGRVTAGQAIQTNANGTVTIRGWANGSGSADGGMPPDFVENSSGSFGIAIPTVISGVDSQVDVTISTTKSTKLTRDGKPFEPAGDASQTPMQRLLASEFGDSPDTTNEPFSRSLEQHELTIVAHRTGSGLVADTVDIDTTTGSADSANLVN